MKQHKLVIAFGDAFNGLRLVGPFDTASEAHEYADKEANDTYVIVGMDEPEEN